MLLYPYFIQKMSRENSIKQDNNMFSVRRQEDMNREQQHSSSRNKAEELRNSVLFIQEKIRELERIERGNNNF